MAIATYKLQITNYKLQVYVLFSILKIKNTKLKMKVSIFNTEIEISKNKLQHLSFKPGAIYTILYSKIVNYWKPPWDKKRVYLL